MGKFPLNPAAVTLRSKTTSSCLFKTPPVAFDCNLAENNVGIPFVMTSAFVMLGPRWRHRSISKTSLEVFMQPATRWSNHLGLPSSLENFKACVLEKSQKSDLSQHGIFWDFDGTILDGDITEGAHHREPFPGLADFLIENCWLPQPYQGETGKKKFWKDYTQNFKTKLEAYDWAGHLLSNHTPDRVEELKVISRQKIHELYRHRFFDLSLDILTHFFDLGFRQFIISASPHVFLSELHHFLPFEEQDIFGVYIADEKGGFPFQYGEGKKLRVESLSERYHLNPLLALGNSWDSDGDMIRACIDQGGTGLLINDKPPRDCAKLEGLFLVQGL